MRATPYLKLSGAANRRVKTIREETLRKYAGSKSRKTKAQRMGNVGNGYKKQDAFVFWVFHSGVQDASMFLIFLLCTKHDLLSF